MAETRLESDSIGERAVPAGAYYGVQSLRGAENFPITGQRLCGEFIDSLAEVKKAAAQANMAAGLLDARRGSAIVAACDEILAGKLHGQFIVDPVQGGAGTSMNMNANEVIANRAIELLGGRKGDYSVVHPNDHVNCGQSTNDVVPTAGKLTALRLLARALPELTRLRAALAAKASEFDGVVKMGRTQLQDAVPIRLGQEFAAYAHTVSRDILRIRRAQEELRRLNLGGTAIGTGLNADARYFSAVVPALSQLARTRLTQAGDLVGETESLECFVAVSGALKTCAVDLSKMASDLRLMSSGPRTGLGEINLPAKQNGSSIMPGKVNPVVPEVVNQIAFQIIGNDLTITMAAEAGQLELNAFEPVLFFNLFQSITMLERGARTFTDNCVSGITANEGRCRELVERSVGIVTPLCTRIGYRRAAGIAKEAIRTGEQVRSIILREKLMDPRELDEVLDPAAQTRLPCAAAAGPRRETGT